MSTGPNRPQGNPFQPGPLPPGGAEDFLGLGAELGLNAPPGLQPRSGAPRPAPQGPPLGQQAPTGFFLQPGVQTQTGIQPQPGLFAHPGAHVPPAPLTQTSFQAPLPAQRPPPLPAAQFPPSWFQQPQVSETGHHVVLPAQRPVPPAPPRAPAPPAVRSPALPPLPRPAPVAMPQQELLPAGGALNGKWPEVRPNNWRVNAPPAPEPADRASWLLELADGAVPPAHPSFVPRNGPSNASFSDGSAATQHVAPWFVRGLLILAGLFLCAVITKTLLLSGSRPAPAPSVPVQPTASTPPAAGDQLLTPSEADAQPSAKRAPARTKPRKSAVPKGSDPAPPQGAALEAPAPVPAHESEPEPESPALVVYTLPASPAPPLAAAPAPAVPPPGGPLGPVDDAVRERIERWLAQQSRAASPLSDLGAFRALAPARAGDRPVAAAATDTGAPVPAAAGQHDPSAAHAGMSGIWEGSTVPIEALDGTLRLETPAVGRVRVRLDGAQREEGRLTAIGQGRVWLTTAAGPITIESARLRGLEQIAEIDRGPTSGPAAIRQKVRTPGGVFFGRVVAREGRTVTLVTDAGARLTVDADEISAAEPAAARPARPERP